MDAITSGNLLAVIGDIMLPVLSLTIDEELGQHGMLSVDMAAEPEMKDYILYEGGNVGVYTVTKDAGSPLFYGIVNQIKSKIQGQECIVHLEARTASYFMDIDPQNRVYQDLELTSHQLADKIMAPYPQSQILFTIPDEPLREMVVQYQETDWAFFNRFLSRYGSSACVFSMSPNICLRTGTADTESEVDWDGEPYVSFRCATQGGDGIKKQMGCKVEAYEILMLGEMVRFHGRELYIKKIRRSLKEGLLASEYLLSVKESITIPKYYNSFLSGVSINGIITDVSRNMVQADLEADALVSYKSKYFFPFSTVAASPDGSGWYCMPQKGDRMRVFFPTDDETDGYAIANIMGKSAPAQEEPMGNPDLKDITTPDGKSVKFVEGGIRLSVGGDKGSVTLTNDGKAEIRTDESIGIHAGNEIHLTTEGAMEVTAGTQIQVMNDVGGNIRMTKDTVEIKAAIIESN